MECVDYDEKLGEDRMKFGSSYFRLHRKNLRSHCVVKNVSHWRSTLSQIIVVSIKNLLLLDCGMTIGFPTLLIPVLSGGNDDKTFLLEAEGISWTGSIGSIFVPIGCFFSGFLAQPFGRKRAMQFVNLPFLGSWLLFYFSTEIWHIFAALILAGMAGGLMEAPIITYVAEVTEPRLRGTLLSTSPMCVIAGSMVQFVLASFLTWRKLALCNSVVPISSFLLLFLVPETPSWYLSKKKYAEAKQSLAWLRGWVSTDDVENEYRVLLENTEVDVKRSKIDKLRLFARRNFWKPYIIVSYVFFLAHFNGMSAVQTYAVQIFSSLGSPIEKYHATGLLGIINFVGCIFCVALIRYTGRRALTFASLGGTFACFLILGLYAKTFNIVFLSKDMIKETANSYSWIPFISLMAAALLCHMGIRILPWILTGEFYPNETRSMAAGVSSVGFYVFAFLCNKFFLLMISYLNVCGTFWFYSAMSLTGLVVLFFVLPETEGKTLQDISDYFLGNTQLENEAHRGDTVHEVDDEVFENDLERKL